MEKRGEGLKNLKRYKWCKQPNGKFTIFDVPVFACYKDPEKGEVTKDDLDEIVKTFREKKEKWFYPRLHVGHHESLSNRPGAGFLDHFSIKKEILYADLVEIPEECFREIQDLKFPYLSVEYKPYPAPKKINTAALLESHTPFFDFPLIGLEEAEASVSEFQELYFHERNNRMIYFQKNFEEKDKEKEKDKGGACPCSSDEPEKKFGDDDSLLEEGLGESGSLNDQLFKEENDMGSTIEACRQLIKEEVRSAIKEAIGAFATNQAPNPAQGNSVAFQANTQPQQYTDAIGTIQHQMEEMLKAMAMFAEDYDSFKGKIIKGAEKSKLSQMCKASGISYQEHAATLETFSSFKDKAKYVEALSTKGKTKVANDAVQTFISASPELSKITDPQGAAVARQAAQIYQEIEKQEDRNSRMFMASFPEQEKFVTHVIEASRKNPKYLQEMFQIV